MSASLIPFFRPQGIAVIGVSTSPGKLGYGVARNLVESGYQGAIHFVSQKAGSLFDRPLFADIGHVPDPVDLAILIVPPQATVELLEACGRRGIRAGVVVSAGFREAGPEGAILEARCLETAQRHGMRLLGPNCIGIIDTHLPLDTTFLQPPMPVSGHIGFISHSGAFCAAIIDWARGQAFGFSQIVSLGNQVDVNETDILPMLAADENTRVIALYMEGTSDGLRFVEGARRASRTKPIVALKVGRFESGQKAAASHTGALAGSDAAFDAAFQKAGILRAATAEQMFDWARALESCPLPAGRRTAVLTNAGGPGVIAADALEMSGLCLAALSPVTRAALADILPAVASVQNPVDMLASASPEQYASCLELLLRDEGVDSVMVILPPPPMFKAEDVAGQLVHVIHRSEKPVLIALLGSTLVEAAARVFHNASIPAYPFPERAASAIAALAKRAEYLRTILKTDEVTPAASTPDSLGMAAQDLIAAYGIPVAQVRMARDSTEAVRIAGQIGYPVVMKIASPDVLHKSDAGGILLNINSPPDIVSGYAQIVKNVRAALPHARIEGVHLQRQVPAGQEVIVGMVRDPLFGPLMMFGSGGVEVEGLKDIAFALAPLTEREAHEMISGTWAGRKLKGFRNIPPADESAVAEVLLRLSRLAMENPDVEEIEINPLNALIAGAVAVDVRMKRTQPVTRQAGSSSSGLNLNG